MKVLEIYPKEIHIVFEISLKELEMLHKALEMVKIDYDSKNEEESRSVNYLTESFFPVIDKIMRKKGNES